MSRISILLTLLLLGCPEYNLQSPEAKPDDPIDTGPPLVDTEPPVDTQDTQPPPPLKRNATARTTTVTARWTRASRTATATVWPTA